MDSFHHDSNALQMQELFNYPQAQMQAQMQPQMPSQLATQMHAQMQAQMQAQLQAQMLSQMQNSTHLPMQPPVQTPVQLPMQPPVQPLANLENQETAPIQPYLRAILIEGSILGAMVPVQPRFQIEQDVVNILQESKEYSYISSVPPTKKKKKKKGKKASQPAEGEEIIWLKRTAPELVDITPLPQDPGNIPEDVQMRPDMTPHERRQAEIMNNENGIRREDFNRHKNNISARRGRERRANRARQLAEDKARGLAERNYWKARAYGLGADSFEWDMMPTEQKEDYVADFRVDIDSLLGKQVTGGGAAE